MISTAFGRILCRRVFGVLLRLAFAYLKKVITPTVSGVVVMLIGLSLVHVGITDFGGGFGAKQTVRSVRWKT